MMSTVSEKLLQVAQNNPKVYHSGQLNIVKNAECLKGSKSGSAMLLDDVSPVTHEMGVKVRSKNLIPYPYYDNFTELHGVTYTINSDGSVTASGVITKGTNFMFCMGITLKAGTYTLSGVSNFSGMILKVYDNTEKIQLARVALPQTSVTFTITQDYNNVQVYLNQAAVGTEVSGTVYPQLELGTTATDYTSYVSDLTAVKVKRCEKNLFNQYADTQMVNNSSYRGIVITDLFKNIRKNGVLSVSLKEGSTFQQGIYFGLISALKSGSGVSAIWFQLSDSTDFRLTKSKLSEMDYNGSRIYLIGIYPSNISDWNRIIDNYNIQIELGSTATEYEPYITPTEYTSNTDGIVEGVTSLYPNTTLMTDTDGVLIDCEYYKDIDKTFNELTTSVALSGGDA